MKKKGLIISIILGVVLVTAGILVLLLLPKKSNKEVFTDALGKSLGLTAKVDDKELENTISDFKSVLEKNIYKITIKSEAREDEAGYSKSDDVIYFGKNQLYLKSQSLVNDKTINLEGMLKDNKFYFEFKDVLDKVYYIDKINEIFNVAAENNESELFEKLVTYLGDSFTEAINNEDVKTDKAELTINGKKYNAKKYGYTFTGETLYGIATSFIDKLKADDTIYDELKKAFEASNFTVEGYGKIELTKEVYEAMLDQLPEYAKQLKSLGELATLNIYMYDDEPISRQLTINVDSELGKIPMTISDYTIDGYYKLALSTMGMEAYKLEVKEQSSTNYSISLYMMEEEIITGYMSNKNENYELKLETAGNLSGNSLLLKINNDGTGSLNIKTDYSENNVEYKIETVDEVPEMDVKGSVSVEEMTDEEKEKLEEFMEQFNVFGKNMVLDQENALLEVDA